LVGYLRLHNVTSKSALQTTWICIAGCLVHEILCTVSQLNKGGKFIVFCWDPGNTGLPGTETADGAAEDATLLRYAASCSGTLAIEPFICFLLHPYVMI
jgi:hypothetical protein